MSVPAGLILAWLGSADTIPAGWTRRADMNARYPTCVTLSSSSGGALGGSASHTHADSGHDHTGPSHSHGSLIVFGGPTAQLLNMTTGSDAIPDTIDHEHILDLDAAGGAVGTAIAGWAPVVAAPPSVNVLWIESPGAWKLPANAIGWFNDGSLPADTTELTSARGKYLRGAPAGTTTGGGTIAGGPHAHAPAGPHAHVGGGTHTVSGETPATGPHAASLAGSSPAASSTGGGHDHPTFTPTAALSGAGSVTSGASGAETLDPPYVGLLHLQITVTQTPPIGFIAAWLGAADDLGSGWVFCDGSGSTPDLRDSFIKGVAAADLLTTGGAVTHGHAGPLTHNHPLPGHIHAVTATGFTGTPTNVTEIPFSSSVEAPVRAPHTHPTALAVAMGLALPENPGGTYCPVEGAGTSSSDAQPIADSGDARPLFLEVAFVQFVGSDYAVTVTAPTVNQVETTPTPTVSWTLPGGRTQAHYRVTVLNTAETLVIYDSGWQASAAGIISLPAGSLANLTSYKVVVTVDDTLGSFGESSLVPFSVHIPAPVAPTGVVAVAVGGDTSLPGVQVSWNAYTPIGGATFQHWTVYRRVHGTSDWTALATISAVGTLTYTDYTFSGSATYDYTVSYAVLEFTVYSLESVFATPATISVIFTGVWIYPVGDPGAALHFRSSAETVTPMQDQRIVPVWGRRQPTVHVGVQHWHKWTFTGIYHAFPDLTEWQAIDGFLDQHAAGVVLVVRFGNTGEQFYGVIDATGSGTQRADALFGGTPSLAVNETFYDGGGA